MQRFVSLASALGCASVLLVSVATAPLAQVAPDQAAAVLERMRVDLAERRFAAVIARGNGLLESARAISTPLRIELWQLLAAAYYPEAADAQQPDSAALPLEALIRLAPDITIARDISWSGLDELTEQTRAQTFAAVTRPLAEYSLRTDAPGRLAVVASRPTRFRLTSVDEVSGRTVIHDSSTFVARAELQLRTHDAEGPTFTDGVHQLIVVAYDLRSGDSLRIVHRVRAQRDDLPAPVTDSSEAVADALPVVPVAVATPKAPARAAPRRSAMLWGGLALAAATAIIAQDARPDDALGSTFLVDARAFVISVTMAGAAAANFFTPRAAPPPEAQTTVMLPVPSPLPPPVDVYRVRLVIDPPER